MREKHREPEVPEGKVPVVECLDGLARITSKELAITHFVEGGTLQNACSTRPRVVAGLGKSACSCAHRQVDEQPTKRSKKNDDKSAVAMLKNGDCMKVLLSIKVTIDQGNMVRNVVTKWNEDHLMHDNWVVYFKI